MEPNKQGKEIKLWGVYLVMGIICAFCLWLIFKPSPEDKARQEQDKGFNADIPDPKKEGIVADKKTAYEQEQMRLKQQEKMRSLDEFGSMTDAAPAQTDEQARAEYERQLKMAPKPAEYYENPAKFEGSGYRATEAYRRQTSAQSSTAAYRDINATMSNFYEEPKQDKEKEEMKAKLEELQAALTAQGKPQDPLSEQMALMEKSYELAAKYNGQGGKPTQTEAKGRKVTITPVEQVQQHVVSALTQPMSNAEFVKGFSQPRNLGFNSPEEATQQTDRNTIGAVVHGEQTVIDGQNVRLRLTEAMRAGQTLIPANTLITGMAKITGERLDIAVTTVEYGGRIIDVSLTAFDTDGQEGIRIPGSMELSAAKEIIAGAGSNLGSTFTFSQQSAGEQLLTDAGRGLLQGTSQYIGKKARQVKATIKAGYRIMLLPERLV